MSQVLEPVQAAREAIAQRRWQEAHELLAAADADGRLGAEDLERLGEAATWVRDPVEGMPYFERAYAAHLEAGNTRRAGYLAAFIGHYYSGVRLQRSIGSGWIRRATRLLADEPEGPEHGYLALEEALVAWGKNDLETTLEKGKYAEELGRRYGDRALEVRGLQRQAMALINSGELEEGKLLLDEAAAAAMSGELDPYSTIVVYCNTIGACRDVAAFDQAGEWTERATAYCESQAVNPFPGMCRVNRAEIMRFHGKLDEAEETAAQASRELSTWAPRIAAAAYYELGEVRLLLGELAQAQEAFDQADGLGHDPEPGRSLLLLARRRVAPALASIRRALTDETVSYPGRARLLPALVRIAIEAGDVELAREGAEELRAIAERYATPALLAGNAHAEGSVRLAEGDADGAIRVFRRALRLWQETNAPYNAAQTRLMLGTAYRAVGDEDAAMNELEHAVAAFSRLGARLDRERAAELLGRDAGEKVTKTFLLTDIVNSTRTAEVVGDAKWTKALRWHDQTLREIFRLNEGEVVSHTGDGFLVAFDDRQRAVDAAIAVQRALRSAPGITPDVRIGLHADEATHVGENYHGKGVHVAARIGALAGACDIVASKSFVEGVSDVRWRDEREVELKGVAEPVAVVNLVWR
ncbi:MAG: tetratricopeptide repeat protein [Thermoleophilia bacterium]|nr:tetratricopeptide repeat protein [Thermoleophilia bacterium]